MIRKTITAIRNFFTDRPQEPETIFKPLVKLPPNVEIKKEIVPAKDDLGFFKNDLVKARSELMHPFVKDVMIEMCEWVKKEYNFHPIVTETFTTVEEDRKIMRASTTHREGRAFDLRTRGWSKWQVEKFQKHFIAQYGHLGAIGIVTGKPILILHHDTGSGPHFHIQFNKEFCSMKPRSLA
jgi:hypothetical protein